VDKSASRVGTGARDDLYERESRIMNIRPLGNRVLVQPYRPDVADLTGDDPRLRAVFDGLTADLPDTTSQGFVLAVGTGAKCGKCGTPIPIPITVGDMVAYSDRVGQELIVDGAKALMIDVAELLAIVAPKAGS
jgi:co-chaperonin GroES (HSP10)